MADWGEILAGALAGGIGGWADAQVDVAKKEREAERQEGLKKLEIEWEETKIGLQTQASKDLKKMEIDATKEVQEAAAKRAAAKEEQDDKWEQKKWESDQNYKEESLALQGQAANKSSSEVQTMEWLEERGLLGEYMKGKGGTTSSPAASAYGAYLKNKLADDDGEDAMPFDEFNSTYFTPGGGTKKKKPDTFDIINQAKQTVAEKNAAGTTASELPDGVSFQKGH